MHSTDGSHRDEETAPKPGGEILFFARVEPAIARLRQFAALRQVAAVTAEIEDWVLSEAPYFILLDIPPSILCLCVEEVEHLDQYVLIVAARARQETPFDLETVSIHVMADRPELPQAFVECWKAAVHAVQPPEAPTLWH